MACLRLQCMQRREIRKIRKIGPHQQNVQRRCLFPQATLDANAAAIASLRVTYLEKRIQFPPQEKEPGDVTGERNEVK
ncbi:hypothetical protein CDAR_523161 [Caerostris darwini]|uniref:Uncharacterized protein n=1 Tax=Caerostris darwini TaxID=1538125 RepID=A0AAV4U947_9ARAC|nr:hypothetical protein CDAR_523161 [Caerostris darwini]